MQEWIILGVVVIFLAILVFVVRRGRSPAAEGLRGWAHSNDWAPFVLGYEEALRDIERTGLEPISKKHRRECAEDAFQRIYIKR